MANKLFFLIICSLFLLFNSTTARAVTADGSMNVGATMIVDCSVSSTDAALNVECSNQNQDTGSTSNTLNDQTTDTTTQVTVDLSTLGDSQNYDLYSNIYSNGTLTEDALIKQNCNSYITTGPVEVTITW